MTTTGRRWRVAAATALSIGAGSAVAAAGAPAGAAARTASSTKAAPDANLAPDTQAAANTKGTPSMANTNLASNTQATPTSKAATDAKHANATTNTKPATDASVANAAAVAKAAVANAAVAKAAVANAAVANAAAAKAAVAKPAAAKPAARAKPTAAARTTRATRTTSTKPATGATTAKIAARPVVAPRPSYPQRADVRDFVDALAARDGLDRDALLRRLDDARYSDTAARLMAPAVAIGGRRDWNVYRARFVEPVRLAAGFAFWDDNDALLARAEREFGVPPEIVVGILGVETVYGRNTGTFRVLDALATLAFDYPSGGRDRSAFFREQLAFALAMDRDGTIDLGALRGSYAGAIGMPQFMPGSIRQFAVDYDGDGRVDLVGTPADIVGSVANFLARHGWVRGLPTHVPLAHPTPLDPAQAMRVDAMIEAGSAPSFQFADFVDAGFVATSMPPMAGLALIDLPIGADTSGAARATYVAGTQNFHVITRYNRSYFYAMSVIELGATIKALRDARDGRASATAGRDAASGVR